MIAERLMSPKHLRRAPKQPTAVIERETARAGIPPAEGPAKITTQFQPLEPAILSEDIPAFFIGRNKEGFWVARDVNGQIGGIFLLENSALSFAKRNSQPAGCATIFPSERIELDLENKGNPLVVHLGRLKRVATFYQRRMTTFLGRLTTTIRRLLKDFHVS